MKIKTKKADYSFVKDIKPPKRKPLRKPSFLFSTLIRLLSIPDLLACKFSYRKMDMEKAGKGPYLILMNHSCFLDPKIVSKIFMSKSLDNFSKWSIISKQSQFNFETYDNTAFTIIMSFEKSIAVC